MPDRPWSDTDRELVADVLDAELGLRTDVHLEVGAAVLDAVAPLIAARVRAETADGIAEETDALTVTTRYATPSHDFWAGFRNAQNAAAAIARAHHTTPGDDHA